jgi:hypothetical protein
MDDSDHTTSTTSQDYEAANEELKCKIRYLNSEIQIMQSLLENHKNCSKYQQNSSSLNSKVSKTQTVKCPA